MLDAHAKLIENHNGLNLWREDDERGYILTVTALEMYMAGVRSIGHLSIPELLQSTDRNAYWSMSPDGWHNTFELVFGMSRESEGAFYRLFAVRYGRVVELPITGWTPRRVIYRVMPDLDLVLALELSRLSLAGRKIQLYKPSSPTSRIGTPM